MTLHIEDTFLRILDGPIKTSILPAIVMMILLLSVALYSIRKMEKTPPT
jgi:hypothetical protein